MAKGKKGFTNEELDYLSNISDAELDRLITQKLGHASTAQAPSTMPQQTMPQDMSAQPSAQGLDLNNMDPAQLDSQINSMFDRYVDPATLESRPDYANGSAPERAIPKAVDGATWNRFKLSFGNKKPDEKVKYLEQDYGAGNVVYNQKRDQYSIKKDGAWYQLDPEGGGQGDFVDRALERTRDVLADNADIAASVGLGIATAVAAAPLAAGLTGLAAVGGAGAVGAAAGAGGAMGRILMGRLVGTYEATPEEMLRDIAVETLISAAGGSFIPGAKWGTGELSKKFAKAAPVLQTAEPQNKKVLAEIIGFFGGFGSENAERMINRGTQVAAHMDKYKASKGLEAALLDQVRSTQALAQHVAGARLAYGKDLYNGFVKEAGEEFSPWVGKIFTESNANASSISLIKQGVVKYANGKISLNVVDDATNVFSNPAALKALSPLVSVMNRFNKMGVQTGEKGARAYLSFKELLNNALGEAENAAEKAGGDLAMGAVRNFKREVLEAYANKAIDGVKSPGLVNKLIDIDGEYARISNLTEDFVGAAKKGGDFKSDYYRKLYETNFAPNKITTKTALKNDNIKQVMDTLGKYDSKLQKHFDDILDRKAAIAGSPLIRPGMQGNVQTATGAAAGLFASPLTGGLVMAASSPRVNYNVARMASTALDSLNNFNRLSPVTRTQLLKSTEAMKQFAAPILEVPGIEAQTRTQLQQMLKGGGNGQ